MKQYLSLREAAAKETEVYLTSPDMGARLSACMIYAYANLPMGQMQRARFAAEMQGEK